MKIKRSQLRRLINEELARVLNEADLERSARRKFSSYVTTIYGRRLNPDAEGVLEIHFDVEDAPRSGSVDSVMTNVEIHESTHDEVRSVGEYFVNRPYRWRGVEDGKAPVTPGSYTFRISLAKR